MASLKTRIASAFYVERVHEDGRIVEPTGLRRPVVALNQALAERGVAAPWSLSAERCRQYWADTANSDANNPSNYYEKGLAINDFVHELWSPEVGPGSSVLELGCNAGPNLERLRQLGYRRLGGIEINPKAIEAMRRLYPELDADIRVGSFESLLPEIEPDSWDVVFTMGVSMHIHPASHDVFAEMVRIARAYVATIEPETATNSYVFARNYRRVFERLGCTEVRSAMVTPESAPEVDRSYDGCVVRLLRAPNVPSSVVHESSQSPAGAKRSR